jgi:hypothetical protein
MRASALSVTLPMTGKMINRLAIRNNVFMKNILRKNKRISASMQIMDLIEIASETLA